MCEITNRCLYCAAQREKAKNKSVGLFINGSAAHLLHYSRINNWQHLPDDSLYEFIEKLDDLLIETPLGK
jgi:predicted peroxiredoxin